jgi:protein SCO1
MRKALLLRWGVVALVVMAAMAWGYNILTTERKINPSLPVYGQKSEDGTEHRVAGFSFVNQDGRTVTEKDFEGNIYVADFFFINCEGICPAMSAQMKRVHDHFIENPSVMLLSHTVKPEEDSVGALKKYSVDHGADPGKWHFVTGDKESIYRLARESYLVTASEGDGGHEDLVHTQYFALVDGRRRLRGFYDGTDSAEVNKLIGDINILNAE